MPSLTKVRQPVDNLKLANDLTPTAINFDIDRDGWGDSKEGWQRRIRDLRPMQHSGGIVIIGAESIRFADISGAYLIDCERGYNNTIAAEHKAGEIVRIVESEATSGSSN